MKKYVAGLLIISVLLFSGCMQSDCGYLDELTQNRWEARLSGGGKVSLRFSEDTAALHIENAGEKADITGRYLADESTFVVFVPEIGQNYGFSYEPRGNTLVLQMGENRITLRKK